MEMENNNSCKTLNTKNLYKIFIKNQKHMLTLNT